LHTSNVPAAVRMMSPTMIRVIIAFSLTVVLGRAQSSAETKQLLDTSPALVTTELSYHPLERSERWAQFSNDYLTGRSAFLRSFKTAVISQVNGSPSGWPSNTRGFADRLASSYVRNATQGAITDGMAAMLGHDTRYFSCQCTGIARRLTYSMRMTVMTRDSEGRKVFDVSRLAGIYGGAMLVSSWQPHTLNWQAESARLTGLGVSTALLTNVAREFKPELKAILRRH
jgi:hypothetical protein